MSQAASSPTADSACFATPSTSALEGYHVEFLANGEWRMIEDDLDEPRIFLTRASAHLFAAEWSKAFGISTRVIDLDGNIPTLDEMEEMWLALRMQEAAEDRARYERYRRRSAAPILEKAIEDEAKYGEAA